MFVFLTAKGYNKEEKAELLSKCTKALKTQNAQTFQAVSEELSLHPKFGDYWTQNWMTCKEMWAEHLLSATTSYGYLTYNLVIRK